ncbi:glycosyltransferase [Methanobacterium spitsbergense]|uniref:Glycosyltransferase n=1 Tax=Methanobacterium spitsbergense TaxID=2874285 RepID=A0A8T5V619_9EURY|nr:glycosyltransferase [Methanobacterium spitsbergense]MBZ2167085.1 glycosyltransferase [Methanobacterium spitsbergense]
MNRFWDIIMHPIIEKVDAKYIVEIGSDTGINTKNILEYCKDHDAHMTAVDPSPRFDVNGYKAEYGEKFEIFKDLSLNKLSQLKDYDVILVDGDHNWYTVYNELKTIERNFFNKKFPIVFLHDIGWPYARRDLYYNSENIPETYRQPYKKLGILQGKPDLQEEGGLNSDLNNAVSENTPKNGVLTAIEDFIEESDLNYSFVNIKALFGLGILYPKDKIIDKIVKNTIQSVDLVDFLEKERVKMVIKRSDQRTQIQHLNDEKSKLFSKVDKFSKKVEKISKDRTQLSKRLNQLEIEIDRLNKDLIESESQNKLLEKQLEEAKEEASEERRKYIKKVGLLEDTLSEHENELEYRSNKYRSFRQRMVSKFPFLYMLMYLPKTGFRNTLINRKGYHAIKNKCLVDTGYYLKNNQDVKLTGKDPIIHYIYNGFREGRKPNPTFEGEEYLNKHKDVKNSNLNPLVHYALYGIKEKRKNQEKMGLVKKKTTEIKGEIHFTRNVLIIGFLAVIGEYSPREALIEIDNKKFSVMCDEYRADLEKNGVNNGYHSYTLNVPPQLLDGEKHTLRLFDKATGKLIASEKRTFSQPRRYRDLSGYLGNSLVSPIVYVPFLEQDKRVFASMENITRYLTNLSESYGDLPLVSVIMPVYNSIETLQAAVNSILNQTYKNIELIIIDCGSDDGSYELTEKFQDENVILIRNPEFKEPSQARNLGLTAVHGKYIAYLDPNNIWDNRYVAAMMGAFKEHPDADAIYSGQLLFKENGKNPFAVRFGSLNRSLLENRNYMDINALCHTSDLYKSIGGFDESLGHYTDWDWILQISNNAQMYSVPVILSQYYCKGITDDKTDKDGKYLKMFREKQAKRKEQARLDRINSPLPVENNLSIIIPSYESLEDISECIESILELNASEWIEIIVVDNASSRPVLDYLSGLALEGKIKLIENDTNYGFTFAVNQGIASSEPGNDILLMNNDAMLTPGAIEIMQNAAYKLPDCGIIVPQQVLPKGSKTLTEHVPFANPQYECDVNLSWLFDNMINIPISYSGKFVELNFAPFFCVFIKRDVLDNSVGLDAEFGRHYRSDRIFCNYIRHVMKLKIYHVTDAVVYHKVQKSTDELRERSKDDFEIMFQKNQWHDELAEEFGYKKPLWDF